MLKRSVLVMIVTIAAVPVLAAAISQSTHPVINQNSLSVLLAFSIMVLGGSAIHARRTWMHRRRLKNSALQNCNEVNEVNDAWSPKELFATLHPVNSSITAQAAPAALSDARAIYLRSLKWVTNLFGSIRVFTFVPTIITLLATADSRSYNLLSWVAWSLANATMTLSIYESNGRKWDHLVLSNACTTMMCLVTTGVILYLR